MIALAAVSNVIHIRSVQHASLAYFLRLTEFLTPLACWLLVISAVHEERLVGDKQYWLTRPFSWKTLLVEKALLLLVFINLPMLVFQCVAMAMAGFSPLDWVSALIWRQVFVSIFFVMPAVAMGAVTRSLGQVVIIAVAVYLGSALGASILVGGRSASNWGNLGWMKQCEAALLMLAGTAAVVALQYARRRTALAAPIFGGVLLLCLASTYTPVWGGAFRIQELFSREPALAAQVRLSVNESRIGSHPTHYVSHSGDPEGVRLEIPLNTSLPPGLRLAGQWSSVRIASARGEWRSGWLAFPAFHESSGDGAWFTVYVPREFYDANKDVPVSLSCTLDLALFRQIAVFKGRQRAGIPRTGLCNFLADGQCYAPTRRFAASEVPPDTGADLNFATLAPFPMEASFQTMSQAIRWGEWLSPTNEPWDVYLSQPVAYTHRAFEARDVQMSKLHLDAAD
jgi:hypothetical protein